jgi:Flp pilus assembly pilin Flp
MCDGREEIVVELEMSSEMSFWKSFWQNQGGQDLVEYSLLLAFVCLVSAALFIGVGRNVAAIWGYTSTSMQQAYCAASSSS